MLIPLWQRLIGAFIYMLPWSDALPFGTSLFIQFPLLQWIAIPAFPLIILERLIPLGSLILFFVLFLFVIRNPKVPYFIRFNTLQALLLDITIILISYAFRIILQPLGSGLMMRTFSSTILVGVLTIIIFTISESLKGNEADLPLFSEAVKMQL